MRRLNADWVTFRLSAEREKLAVLASLTKSSSHFSSMHLTHTRAGSAMPEFGDLVIPYQLKDLAGFVGNA